MRSDWCRLKALTNRLVKSPSRPSPEKEHSCSMRPLVWCCPCARQ
jgi:hypothetical protein